MEPSEGEEMRGDKRAGVDLGLSDRDKETLLHIAKTVIQCKARGKSVPKFRVDSSVLKEKRGAFVTVNKGGQLRGCIGYIKAHKPLYQTVEEMAAQAAFHDPRFDPVTERELPDLAIEISVLTPLKRIKDVEEVQVGKHGIIIEKGFHSGLLLPQVAAEYGWDRKTFLEHTCFKAGLPKDAWQDEDTIISIFSADIF
jgi:AmmeMemoRadiSam system protein A